MPSTWPRFTAEEGVLFIGATQERPSCFAPSAAAMPMAIPTRRIIRLPLGWSTTSISIATTTILARSSSRLLLLLSV